MRRDLYMSQVLGQHVSRVSRAPSKPHGHRRKPASVEKVLRSTERIVRRNPEIAKVTVKIPKPIIIRAPETVPPMTMAPVAVIPDTRDFRATVPRPRPTPKLSRAVRRSLNVAELNMSYGKRIGWHPDLPYEQWRTRQENIRKAAEKEREMRRRPSGPPRFTESQRHPEIDWAVHTGSAKEGGTLLVPLRELKKFASRHNTRKYTIPDAAELKSMGVLE